MKIHIYKIYFSTSSKCYIGQTCDLKRRMSKHLISKSLIGNALRKYDDWVIKILHTCKIKDEANRIEIEEIRNFNSIAPNGYNLTRGGENPPNHTGMKRSKETIERLRIAKQGNQYSKGHYYKPTKEANKKNSGARLGIKGKDHSMYGKKNPNAHTIPVKIKRLKTRINKLEKEIDGDKQK